MFADDIDPERPADCRRRTREGRPREHRRPPVYGRVTAYHRFLLELHWRRYRFGARERQDDSFDYTTARGGWEKKGSYE